MARRRLTGALLVGGASRRFGSTKAFALFGGETLLDRGRRLLEEACDEVLVVGKRNELPIDLVDDGAAARAPIAGVVASLRAARHDVVVCLPVDCPLMTAAAVRALGEACWDAAVSPSGPLPGAWSRRALPTLEHRLAAGRLSLREACEELDVAVVEIDERVLADADTPAALDRLARGGR